MSNKAYRHRTSGYEVSGDTYEQMSGHDQRDYDEIVPEQKQETTGEIPPSEPKEEIPATPFPPPGPVGEQGELPAQGNVPQPAYTGSSADLTGPSVLDLKEEGLR